MMCECCRQREASQSSKAVFVNPEPHKNRDATIYHCDDPNCCEKASALALDLIRGSRDVQEAS